MEAQGWLMLRVLINRFNPGAGNALVKFLPQEEASRIASPDIRSVDIIPLLLRPKHIMDLLHYSWIQPLIEKYPEDMHPIFLGILTPRQVTGLRRIFPQTAYAVSPLVKNFLQFCLYSRLPDNHPLPIDYLPPSEFAKLLTYTKNEIVDLIDLLGLHDLAVKIRSIVNKQHLDHISSCLTPKQQHFLKICLYRKEPLAAPPFDINPADFRCETLKNLIHQRGLARFGKALCGEHPDFIWYIAHILDTGRGKVIQEYYKPDPIPKVTALLKSQVMNVMNFLKKE